MNKDAASSIPTNPIDDVAEELGGVKLAPLEENMEAPEGAIQPADPEDESGITLEDEHAGEEEDGSEPLDVEIHQVQDEDQQQAMENDSVFEDPTDEDDGEGEWITPDNVHIHKSKALGLLPSEANNANDEEIWAGCMTVDFAMQNVLLQMGLNLVGLEGKRIEKIKTWVLRCHACYK